MDAYVHAILSALRLTCEIAETDQASLWGTCSGGILTTMALAYLGATGGLGQVSSLALPVTLLDQQVSGPLTALTDSRLADLAKQRSRRRGYLDGSSLTEMFAWLRPNDLIWNYWVSNYLLGKRPPAFDLLYWNSDSTRMPAALHADFVDLGVGNGLVEPGSTTVMGIPVDLADITVDTFVIGGASDHITPWESCYRTTQLLGGTCEFVLSSSGHVAAMVNPPGNPRASFRHAPTTPQEPEKFLAVADLHQGSWWPMYAVWLAERSGPLRPAPKKPGSSEHPPIEPAPGRYVLDR
jgi:poly(3-hydroxyalkanoate) synthetase